MKKKTNIRGFKFNVDLANDTLDDGRYARSVTDLRLICKTAKAAIGRAQGSEITQTARNKSRLNRAIELYTTTCGKR
jgi:hypothetical protein